MRTDTYDETKWRLVPMEPTTEMLTAGSEQIDLSSHSPRAVWESMVAAAPTPPDTGAGDAGSVQWWLAELDQHGNAKLVDGQHDNRSGADKAMYLINALGLSKESKRYAVARVELFTPKPSADGVNHEAIDDLNRARIAMRASKGAS